ncbi:MAPEG family protein [Octadecabacter sp. G9-8]|uniref:MAPEG family protein n=1 Tax=Octadecabacter dasysiphoniae TaxID=2909341 RepID=A0ABS9CQS0_9RHOB|nr:MAPEG family protein [Octadecabacter dasysiphoniae]MCF2869577.1 MAPEG family protein [Octadecabacter dasysiphoniae]
MTPDLTILALALLLQGVQFVLMAVPANLELGIGKTASARDPERMGGKTMLEQLSTKTARLARAMNNHFEALILFAPAVLIVELSGQNTKFTAACATAYLIARVAYIPAYYFGLSPWRSYIWFVGFGATIAMIVSTLI